MGGDTDTLSPLISTPEEESSSEQEYSGEFDDVYSRDCSSTLGFQADRRRRLRVYSEVLRSYDELKRRSHEDLEDAKSKILSYTPGTWVEKVGGMRLSDYDVPNTTSLLLIGPRGAGKSSLVNRISRVFEVDNFASERAQVSYNSSFGDGTLFLKECMIPRGSNAFCLYDTRSLCYDLSENMEMLQHWMTKGVRHGELVIRDSDSSNLKTRMECIARQNGYNSSDFRTVNFVIFVIDGLSVLKSMNSNGEADKRYTEMIATTFNCPFLSFKDDKPVVVLTHGDLLSLSERARVRVHLGELLGIPPLKQIFDIPENIDPATELTVVDMLRYSLEHADRNLPGKDWYTGKVCQVYLHACLFMLIILGIAIISSGYICPLSNSGSPTQTLAAQFASDLDKATQNPANKHHEFRSSEPVVEPRVASDPDKASQNHANKHRETQSSEPVVEPQVDSDINKDAQNHANMHRASRSSQPIIEPDSDSDCDTGAQNHARTHRASLSSEPDNTIDWPSIRHLWLG